MDNLDFSGLSDDQLVALFVAVCREATSRNPAVNAACQAAGLDEAEKASIAGKAAEREAAAQRARDRQRIAEEAAVKVRDEAERRRRAAADATGTGDRQRVAQEAAEKIEAEKQLIRDFAALVKRPPNEITIVVLNYKHDIRVLVNEGDDRYAREHLIDYHHGDGPKRIKTTRNLVANKPALMGLCFELCRNCDRLTRVGAEYDWTGEVPATPAGATV